jgi:peroxiredoxin
MLEVVHAGYYTLVLVRALALLVLSIAVVASGEAAPAAPGFRIHLLDGKTSLDSRELIGKKVLVLRFQASWCQPCVRQSAALAQLAQRYRARGVELLAIHVQDAPADVQRFVAEQKVTYKVALDPRLSVGNRFGFRGTPYTVVVDLRGEMVARIHGESALTRLPRILDGLLAKSAK